MRILKAIEKRYGSEGSIDIDSECFGGIFNDEVEEE